MKTIKEKLVEIDDVIDRIALLKTGGEDRNVDKILENTQLELEKVAYIWRIKN